MGSRGRSHQLWTLQEILEIKKQIEDTGLVWEAIENFDPALCYDVLLWSRKREQLEDLKTIIRRVGEAGIPIIGYNFSIAGVAGGLTGAFARGEP